MARCDQGYLCAVCGGEVKELLDSDLYLRYVLGEVEADVLHSSPERHIRCNPSQAQFIVDEAFDPVVMDGPFAKAGLDPAYVAEEEERISAGYRRLCELAARRDSILEYPLALPREGGRSDDSPGV